MVRKRVVFHIFLILAFAVFYFYFVEGHHNLKRKPYRDEEQSRRKELGHRGSTLEPGNRATWRDSSPDSAAGHSCSSEYLSTWEQPDVGTCQVRTSNGYPVPDPHCTPGGINPSVTITVLSNPHWRTRLIRNCESSEAQKHIEYRWYGIQKPGINSNENQVCELDHLVPLELGGADGLGNIWPECGPDGVTLRERYFKRKDRVENYLAEQVKTGRLPLRVAQQGIASD